MVAVLLRPHNQRICQGNLGRSGPAARKGINGVHRAGRRWRQAIRREPSKLAGSVVGSGLVGHAAIKFAIAAGHFVIALVRRGDSLSVEGLASEETMKIIEVDFDALDQDQPEISALAPNALICVLGTTIRKAGSKDGFARVDRDYVAAFATLGRAAEPVTSDWCRPSAPMLDPAISICASKAKRKRPFA
jgi:hypothetical protein